jgi:murein peptide amidase A
MEFNQSLPPSPSALTQVSLGLSVQQRPIVGYYAGAALAAPLEWLWVGAFHGDEPQSALLLDALLTQLTLPPNVLVIPIFNPDGLAQGTRVNANGVDLNRNYPTQTFDAVSNVGTHYFGGHTPASEPETQAMIALIERYQPKGIVSVHTPYRFINYDGPAEHWAQVLQQHTGYPIEPDMGYPTPGSFGNWAGVERGIPVITLELPDNEPMATIISTQLPAFQALLAAA